MLHAPESYHKADACAVHLKEQTYYSEVRNEIASCRVIKNLHLRLHCSWHLPPIGVLCDLYMMRTKRYSIFNSRARSNLIADDCST